MNEFDMIVLDEIFASYNYDLLDKASVRNIVENYGGELVMTGRNPDEWFCERADYISEIKKIKHPYDKGIVAREGIEVQTIEMASIKANIFRECFIFTPPI